MSDLSGGMFNGSLPQCLNHILSLTLLTRILMPSLIVNLTSMEYVDFSNNNFEDSFSFSSFSNHTKLEVLRFVSENDKFELKAKEPLRWIRMFQLKVIVPTSCNMNRLVPEFYFTNTNLSHNSLVGPYPNWLIENNTILANLNLIKVWVSLTIRLEDQHPVGAETSGTSVTIGTPVTTRAGS
ncbi:hypothetical protein Ccrd_013412 [Cynara cardunculus var. scolymus]|uniref:Leucine-rich repeat-containing protein n=1 Tax=Cynara cardunculus var. scolymus TaxID=59895 RepID=A0A124SH25_CYNCS|nr:hypothetical protein Ccrd_013412 [Cynara cardunculus var. scolymus]